MSDSPAQHFADMAKRIERIEGTEFAGAVVVVPPDGEAIAFLLTDPRPDIAQFWGSTKSRIEVAAADAIRNAEPEWARR